METVAAGDEIAVQLFEGRHLPRKRMDGWPSLKSWTLTSATSNSSFASGIQASFDQVLQYFVLGVHRHRFSAGKILEIDAMAAPGELQFDAADEPSPGPSSVRRRQFP